MRRAGKKPGRKFRFRQFSHGPRAQGRIWWSRNLQPSFPVIKPQSLLLAAFPPPLPPGGRGRRGRGVDDGGKGMAKTRAAGRSKRTWAVLQKVQSSRTTY